MNIDELTLGQLKQISKLAGCASAKTISTAFKVDQKVLIRTVTHYYTGRVVAVYDDAIALQDASWIADTGRFSAALKTGQLKEVEPYPNGCYVSRGAIVDWCIWPHDLPHDVK